MFSHSPFGRVCEVTFSMLTVKSVIPFWHKDGHQGTVQFEVVIAKKPFSFFVGIFDHSLIVDEHDRSWRGTEDSLEEFHCCLDGVKDLGLLREFCYESFVFSSQFGNRDGCFLAHEVGHEFGSAMLAMFASDSTPISADGGNADAELLRNSSIGEPLRRQHNDLSLAVAQYSGFIGLIHPYCKDTDPSG